MIARFARRQGREPSSIAADATYGDGEFLQWLLERGITPYMRTRDSALGKTFAIVVTRISTALNVVRCAHRKRNARADDIDISPFTSTSRHDKAHGGWRIKGRV